MKNKIDNIDDDTWTYVIATDHRMLTRDLIDWCIENIIDADWDWRLGPVFYFKNRDDAITFRLAWT